MAPSGAPTPAQQSPALAVGTSVPLPNLGAEGDPFSSTLAGHKRGPQSDLDSDRPHRRLTLPEGSAFNPATPRSGDPTAKMKGISELAATWANALYPAIRAHVPPLEGTGRARDAVTHMLSLLGTFVGIGCAVAAEIEMNSIDPSLHASFYEAFRVVAKGSPPPASLC